MKQEEIRTVLFEALQRAKGKKLDLATVREDSHLVKDLGLDSLDLIETGWEIEEKCGIVIREDQLKSLATVSDVVKLVEELTRDKPANT